MSNTQHTPGPWAVISQSDLPDYLGILHVDSSEANARIIAAAPELLAALAELLAWAEGTIEEYEEDHGGDRSMTQMGADGDMPEQIIQSRAAIAKAKGTP